ncbi:hypothetical protein TNCV_4407651 [Trichonephila clavipes]|nr:hypothetical protein TNCV_4407651 [Trichonephila clavipes]
MGAGVKAIFCKTAADCLPANFSSKLSNTVTSKMKSRCLPTSSCIKCKVAILWRFRCSVEISDDLPVTVPLVYNLFYNRQTAFWPLISIEPLRFRLASFSPDKISPSQGNT